jgi:hypothetical protein
MCGRLCALRARWCHNISALRAAQCFRLRVTTSSWTAPARSAGGHKRRSGRTIPVRGCGFWTTTIRRWRRKPRFRAANSAMKCTFERRTAYGSRDSKHGSPCSACCQGSHGSDASPACRQCAGLGLLRTLSSPGTATAFPEPPRAVRAIRARFPGARPNSASTLGA